LWRLGDGRWAMELKADKRKAWSLYVCDDVVLRTCVNYDAETTEESDDEEHDQIQDDPTASQRCYHHHHHGITNKGA
jgi:hypothetical protein